MENENRMKIFKQQQRKPVLFFLTRVGQIFTVFPGSVFVVVVVFILTSLTIDQYLHLHYNSCITLWISITGQTNVSYGWWNWNSKWNEMKKFNLTNRIRDPVTIYQSVIDSIHPSINVTPKIFLFWKKNDKDRSVN